MSEKGQHTPGPWVVGISWDLNHRGVWPVFRLRDLCNIDPRGAEVQANARLIAAAPDLLAACRTAYDAIASLPIEAMDFGHDGELVWPIRDEVLNHIAKAIAKAHGEQP